MTSSRVCRPAPPAACRRTIVQAAHLCPSPHPPTHPPKVRSHPHLAHELHDLVQVVLLLQDLARRLQRVE